jgi:hypothetical protein
LFPAITGSGESVFVTARSADVCTVVVAVAVLLADDASPAALAATAVLVIVDPFGVLAATFTTIVNTAVSPAATVALENTTLPVPPTAGAVVLQPVPIVTVADTNVVLAGTASVTVTVGASLGPLLTKFIV